MKITPRPLLQGLVMGHHVSLLTEVACHASHVKVDALQGITNFCVSRS